MTAVDAAAPIPVLVFARAPVAGAAKTRLAPRLGAVGAARLHALLVEHAIETALSARLGRVELCCAPDASHPFFAQCAERFGVALAAQAGGDLGARMYAALVRVATRGGALLIGSDCPALTPAYLRAAAAVLAGGEDAVFGPAEDGGYVLVGVQRGVPALFDGIDWGTPCVMTETRARLRALRWRWQELALLWDVDRPQDLERLAAHSDAGERLIAEALQPPVAGG